MTSPSLSSLPLILIFASILYMTAVFKGVGNLVEASLDVPYGVAIFIVLVIVMAYTAVGGFHSVVKTDVVQGLFMVVASVLLFIGVVQAAGGVASRASGAADRARSRDGFASAGPGPGVS